MKKYTFFFIAAVALISCSKAETDDLLKTTTEHGDKVVLTSPSIPTRVAISDHQYVFEKSDKIVLVSSRSKRYAVLEQVTEDDATSFQGEFNGNIAEDDTFTAYYNCADTDDATQLEKLVSGTTTLIQNGMPWMSSEGLEYTRDAMGRVTISSPEFSALQGYRAGRRSTVHRYIQPLPGRQYRRSRLRHRTDRPLGQRCRIFSHCQCQRRHGRLLD